MGGLFSGLESLDFLQVKFSKMVSKKGIIRISLKDLVVQLQLTFIIH
jgi:hypothetical protein